MFVQGRSTIWLMRKKQGDKRVIGLNCGGFGCPYRGLGFWTRDNRRRTTIQADTQECLGEVILPAKIIREER